MNEHTSAAASTDQGGDSDVSEAGEDLGSRQLPVAVSGEERIGQSLWSRIMRGSRVQAVVGELQGEKIDIIPWSMDPASFIVNALQPAEVAKVVLDEDAERIEVVVPDDQLSLAIGRRGQNVRLASQLTGWDIDILTEQEESERRQKEFNERTELFMYKEKFLLHYNFPPFSVGETGRTGSPGRREIGHGKLAWRAIHPMLPSGEQFPYTLRVVSEITESNGSSSMATVCGTSLALMDAGVPLAKPVAGIAMC